MRIVLSIEPVAITQSLYLHQSADSTSKPCAGTTSVGCCWRRSHSRSVVSPDADRNTSPCAGLLHHKDNAAGGIWWTVCRPGVLAGGHIRWTELVPMRTPVRDCAYCVCREQSATVYRNTHHATWYTQYEWPIKVCSDAGCVREYSLMLSSQLLLRKRSRRCMFQLTQQHCVVVKQQASGKHEGGGRVEGVLMCAWGPWCTHKHRLGPSALCSRAVSDLVFVLPIHAQRISHWWCSQIVHFNTAIA